MKLYVGNLNFRCSEDELRDLFCQYGPVSDLIILNDRETGRSRGFGFVTIDDDAGARRAVEELAGQQFLGREMVLNEARPRTDYPNQGQGGHSGGYPAGGGNSGGGGGGYSPRRDLPESTGSIGYSGGTGKPNRGYTPRPSGGGYSGGTSKGYTRRED